MPMLFLNIGILAGVALGTWWLTGRDKNVSGENKRDRHFTRALRTVAVVFLFAVLLAVAEGGGGGGGVGGVPLLLIIPVSIALLLRSSLSEVFAGGFLRLVDPTLQDERPFDPGKTQRYLDTIGHLIRNGRKIEAIRLCQEFKKSGDLNPVVLETILEFLGIPQPGEKLVNPLNEAARLRGQRRYAEAEQILRLLLAKHPADAGAAIMLVRLFAQDLQQPERAAEILREFERQPHVDAAHVEFARRSLEEWRQAPEVSPPEPVPVGLLTVDDWLAKGGFGTAVDILTHQVKLQPHDFDLRLKLAEVHGRYCGDLQRAERIIRALELFGGFSGEQQKLARERLETWRAAHSMPGR